MVSPVYPSNPNIGDTYNVGNITFRWDGEKWRSIAPANHENRITSLEAGTVQPLLLAEAVADTTATEGQIVQITDRANGQFQYQTGLTPNTYNIVLADSVTLNLILIEENPSLKMWGASGDGVTDDQAAIQNAWTYSKDNLVYIYGDSGVSYLIDSQLTAANDVLFDGRDCFIRKNFDGLGIQCSGGGTPNTLMNFTIEGWGAGLADNSAATTGHGIKVINNVIRFKNVKSVRNKGNGFEVESASPNMNGCEWGMGGIVQSTDNDGDGFNFSGTNNNASIWNDMYLHATANQGLGIRMATDFTGRQMRGFWYLEDNGNAGGYSVGGEVTSNYIGQLRYSELMIYAEENAAGITKDIYLDTNTDGNVLLSTRLNRWEDKGLDNKIFRGTKEQTWNAEHRFRNVRGINMSVSTDYMEDYFQGSSGAGKLGHTRYYGDGIFERNAVKTSNGKTQRQTLQHPYKVHEVWNTTSGESGASLHRIHKGTEASPAASAVGDYYGHLYQADGSGGDNKTIGVSKFEVGALGAGKPSGVWTLQTTQSGGSVPTDSIGASFSNTAGDTRFLIYDVDNGTLERVTVGAADSGGVGYKVLRILN